MNDDFPPLLSGNDFRFDRVRQALLIAEAVLRGDRDAESERLVFRVLLSDFGVGSDVLTDTQKESLDSLVALAKRFPKTLNVVDIVGRASQTGSEANNVDLSVRRAVAASTYVITSGIAARRLAEPRGIGSANPILNVGPVEEPLNRSADVVFAFDVVPRFETLDPTLRWSVVLGAEVGWLIAGTQKITLIRDDTGERRTGTFNYVDVSISVVPDELMRADLQEGRRPQRLVRGGTEGARQPLETLARRKRFRSGHELVGDTYQRPWPAPAAGGRARRRLGGIRRRPSVPDRASVLGHTGR